LSKICQQLPKSCQKIAKSCQKSNQKVVKKVVKKLSKVAKRLPKNCQKLPKSWQKLPKSCQKIAKSCQKTSVVLGFFIGIFDIFVLECHIVSHCVKVWHTIGVTLVIYVTLIPNIIVMCHWSSNVFLGSLLLTNFNKFWQEGGVGGAKSGFKAFGRRQKTYYFRQIGTFLSVYGPGVLA
jgi:hypothetical protein